MKHFLAILAISFLISPKLSAQSNDAAIKAFYLDLGWGPTVPIGIAMNGCLNLQTKNNLLLSAGAAAIMAETDKANKLQIVNYKILAGYSNNYRSFIYAFSIGPSLQRIEKSHYLYPNGSFDGELWPDPIRDKFTKELSVGVQVEGKFMYAWHWGAVGLNPFLNLNLDQPFGGTVLTFAVGKMPRRN